MLTIYIYKNVPFQINNENVLFIDNDNDKLLYLSQYLVGTKTNIQKFFSNEKYFDLDILYEDCNYMAIYDDRSTTQYKYFFIQKAYFVSNGAVRYELTLDDWFTYGNRINMRPSRMCAGHYDCMEIQNPLQARRTINFEENGEKSVIVHKNLIRSWKQTFQASIVACVNTADEGALIFTCFVDSPRLINKAISWLAYNKYANTLTNPQFLTFESMKIFVISDFNVVTKMRSLYGTSCMKQILVGVQSTTADDPVFYRYYEGENTGQSGVFYDNTIDKISIAETKLFDNNRTYDTITNDLKHKYFVGTFTNNQEIKVDSLSNPTININMYIFATRKIEFYLEFENTHINITNEFETPFINDNYTLYMARNQATIDAQNKANAINLASSIGTAGLSFALAGATGGASLMLGASAITNTLSFGVKNMQQRANIENAKNQIDRTDGLYGGGILTLNNGVHIYKTYATDTDRAQNDFINNFGTNQQIFIDRFLAYYGSQVYNFNYVQFDDINIYGEFAYDIKINFENMFKNGVRIWYDTTTFLHDVNYKK